MTKNLDYFDTNLDTTIEKFEHSSFITPKESKVFLVDIIRYMKLYLYMNACMLHCHIKIFHYILKIKYYSTLIIYLFVH